MITMITTAEAYNDYNLPMPTAGSEKQIAYAMDIIAHPLKVCIAQAEVEDKRPHSDSHVIYCWGRASKLYRDWLDKLAENAGDKFEAGKIINMKERFIETAKGCVQIAAQELDFDKSKIYEFIANMR